MTPRSGATRREALVLGAATIASGVVGAAAVLWRRSISESATVPTSTTTTSQPTSTTAPPVTAPTTTTTTPPATAQSVEVLCRDAWSAAPAGPGTPHRIEQITVHHSATRLDDNRDVVEHIRGYQRSHQGLGWPDLAYHYVIDAEGNVFEARSTDIVGDTRTDYDPTGHFLAMCDGNFEEQPVPEPQFQGLARLLAWAVSEHALTVDRISAHRDHTSTACPGQNLYDRMVSGELTRAVQSYLDGGPIDLRVVCGPEAEARVRSIEGGT